MVRYFAVTVAIDPLMHPFATYILGSIVAEKQCRKWHASNDQTFWRLAHMFVLTSVTRQASSHEVAYLYRADPCNDSGSRSSQAQSIPTSTFHDKIYICLQPVIATPTHTNYAFHSIIYYWLVHSRHTKVTTGSPSLFTILR
jgi:hypothetical protein